MKKRKKHILVLRKLEDRIEAEGHEQCLRAYGAAALALHRHDGLELTSILRVFDTTHDIWIGCANDKSISIIRMCEEETGIEVQNGSGKSWEDVAFLNGQSAQMLFTPAQLAYMRIQQVTWVAASIIACILIALHREYDFDADMCARFYMQVQQIQGEYGMNAKAIAEAAQKETGVVIEKVITKEKEVV